MQIPCALICMRSAVEITHQKTVPDTGSYSTYAHEFIQTPAARAHPLMQYYACNLWVRKAHISKDLCGRVYRAFAHIRFFGNESNDHRHLTNMHCPEIPVNRDLFMKLCITKIQIEQLFIYLCSPSKCIFKFKDCDAFYRISTIKNLCCYR